MSDKEKRESKQYETEWSFSFENLGRQFGEFIGSIGETLGGDEEIITEAFETPRDGANFARVSLRPSVGRHTVKALEAGSANLFEAEVAHVGDVDFSVEGETERTVSLSQKSGSGIARNIRQTAKAASGGDRLYWHMGISPDVPLQLDVNSGVGETQLDLAQLQINGLSMKSGVGKVTVKLPAQETPYAVDSNSGVGETNFHLPQDTTMSLHINAGVGQVNLVVPTGAALRVRVEGGGLGSANIPDELKHVEGRSEGIGYHGEWQTEGFAVAERQLNVEYRGGMGALDIRFAGEEEIPVE